MLRKRRYSLLKIYRKKDLEKKFDQKKLHNDKTMISNHKKKLMPWYTINTNLQMMSVHVYLEKLIVINIINITRVHVQWGVST